MRRVLLAVAYLTISLSGCNWWAEVGFDGAVQGMVQERLKKEVVFKKSTMLKEDGARRIYHFITKDQQGKLQGMLVAVEVDGDGLNCDRRTCFLEVVPEDPPPQHQITLLMKQNGW